jgi:hypothetical protein
MRLFHVIAAALILAAVGGLMVFQHASITKLNYEVGATERELKMLEEQNRIYQAELSRLSGNEELGRRVKAWNLGLEPPSDSKAVKAKS